MEIIEAIIDRIGTRIASEAKDLTDDQRKGSAEWLERHYGTEYTDNGPATFLTTWFENLPSDRLVSELSLFLTEISWWRKKHHMRFR